MTASMRSAESDIDRLLSFEVANTVYALPITAVLEVVESNRASAVPGLARELAAAMNWHGEALPLLASPLLLEGALEGALEEELEGAQEEGSEESPEEGAEEEPVAPPARSGAAAIARDHVLVVTGRSDEAPSLGMPVDRVLGLVEGAVTPDPAVGMVVERRPVDGRVVNILDPQRLVARAAGLIERAVV